MELLITIAIIAILAALLLPTLNSARKTAQRVLCMNNSKNIMQGMILYANTYQYFPYRDDEVEGAHPHGRFWYHKIYATLTGNNGDTLRFYKNSGFYKCPAYQYTGTEINSSNIAYGKNDALGSIPRDLNSPSVKPEQVKRPSLVIAVGDSDDDAWNGMIISGSYYLLGNRHDWKATAGFVDGHSEITSSQKWLAPDVSYGSMNYQTGLQSVRSTGSSIGTTSWPLELRHGWGVRGGGYDYLTK